MESKLKIVELFAIGLALAGLLGYLAQRVRLPTILGFMIAGYLIGPFSPGFEADLKLAEELAELGVILMLFGVGLHFHIEDLINVKNIAIPGALLQTFAASALGTLLFYFMGWTIGAGLIIGLALGVASTVVLVWVLSHHRLLDSPQGHIAIGWLVVEDILTVAFLIMLPIWALFVKSGNVSLPQLAGSIVMMLSKFVLLIVIMFTWGSRLVAYILTNIARLRSHELFTLTLLALVFLIAFGSSYIFGTSIALGAFIAGMVIGKTHVKHQAAANSLPLKDIFAVIFFLSVGMLFDPLAIFKHFPLFLGMMGIILIVKPLVAFLIVLGFGYSLKVALTVAVALAQIGEFSFILAEEGMSLNLIPDDGYDILVACALVSIAINPVLFRLVDFLETRFDKWRRRIAARGFESQSIEKSRKNIVVVGLGPIGENVVGHLYRWKYAPIIIENNIDIVQEREAHDKIIFGDASQSNILEWAHIDTASLLIITISDMSKVLEIIHAARHINPELRILAYIETGDDAKWIDKEHIDYISAEKATSTAFAKTISHLIHQYKI